MDFTVKVSDLTRELGVLRGVVETRTTIPVLAHALIDAKDGGITLASTDLELAIRTACSGKVKKPGRATVPLAKLYNLAKLLPDTEARITAQENHWVKVIVDRKTYKFAGFADDNFPGMPEAPEGGVTVSGETLKKLIEHVEFAITKEESRYTLSGALLEIGDGKMRLVATDGHRLALAEAEGQVGNLKMLIPRKALSEIAKLCDGEGELAADDTHLFFRSGDRLLCCRLLTGQFPNYEAVLPRENDKKLRVDAGEFTAALRRVSQMADQRSHAVKLTLSKEGAALSSASPEYGEAREPVEAKYDGEVLDIGFNAAYLLDFFSVVLGTIEWSFKDQQGATELRPVVEDGLSYRYVVMPMRV